MEQLDEQKILQHRLHLGNIYSHGEQHLYSLKAKTQIFREHYGALPLVIFTVWHSLLTSLNEDARIPPEERNLVGLRQFFVANFLFAYPCNTGLMVLRFKACRSYMSGRSLWKWIYQMAALKKEKIYIPSYFYDDSAETFVGTLDGVDCKIREPKHPTLPIDKQTCSKKFRSSALKYEVVVATREHRIVWVSGGHKAGIHDKTVF